MIIERDILVSVLKLTKSKPVSMELVASDAKTRIQDTEKLLKRLHDTELIEWRDRTIEASSNQRVKIAIHAIKLGADFERVSRVLEWIEFENLAATAFEANNFVVRKRFRFESIQRRWEIDVLGSSKPLIACVDCKHWSHGWRNSAIKKAVEAQVLRTKVMAEALSSLQNKLGLSKWRYAILVPVILSLIQGPKKFHNKVPIVPILQIQNFLNELPTHVTALTHFKAHF